MNLAESKYREATSAVMWSNPGYFIMTYLTSFGEKFNWMRDFEWGTPSTE